MKLVEKNFWAYKSKVIKTKKNQPNKGYYLPWIGKYIYRNCSCLISRPLQSTRITPNQITLFRLFVGIAAAVLLGFGIYILTAIGGILFFFYFVLDCVDGEIARYKKMRSSKGIYLDIISDMMVKSSLFVGMGYGTYYTFGNIYLVILGFAAALFIMLETFTTCVLWAMMWRGEKKKGLSRELGGLKGIYRRSFGSLYRGAELYFMIMIFALFNQLIWIFLITGLLSPVHALVRIVYGYYRV